MTQHGAKFLALKTFPEIFKTERPRIVHVETFVEGVHVYFRLYYTDPINPQNDPLKKVNGFGFVGINGSGWGWENHSFSNPPYWARVYVDESSGTGRIDYPFNHLCGTTSAYGSDVEAWVVIFNPNGTVRDGTPGVPIRMRCSAPKEVITPFFDH